MTCCPDPYPTLPEMLRDWADTALKADTILKEVTVPQSRRDEAIEAGARAKAPAALTEAVRREGLL